MIIGSNTVVATYEPPPGPVWPDDPVVVLGAKLHWLFDYNQGVESGGLITSILDAKGGVLTASDASTARQPVAVTENIAGVDQQFGRSNLVSKGLRTSTTAAGATLLDPGAELYIVHREGSPITIGGGGFTVTGAIVSSMTFSAFNVPSFGFHTVSSQSQRTVRIAKASSTATARGSATTGFAYVANEWCCTRIRVETSVIQIYRNGVFLVDGSIAASTALTPSFGLGFGYNGGPQGSGAGNASAPLDIAHVFMTTTTLTTQELTDVSTYMNARFGVPSYV